MAVSAPQGSTSREDTRPRSLALVANAQAGALLNQAGGSATLEDLLRAETESLEVIAPDAGTLPERVALAIATGADCIVIAGGDGSIACAAAAVAGTQQALGLVPSGTMNLLARDLGLDPANTAAAARILSTGVPRAIDAGCVTGADGETHLFLCASMLGTPARLTRHREAGRRQGGGMRAWAGFGRAATRALLANRSLRLVLRVNGQVLSRKTPSLTITVNPLADNSGHLFGRTILDAGTLALYIVPRAGILRQAWLLLRTAITGTLHVPEIEMIETTEIEIAASGAAIRLLIDGEMRLLQPPLRYTVRPGAVRVIAPPPA
jgi:diacylglycerol kinase family enzyme